MKNERRLENLLKKMIHDKINSNKAGKQVCQMGVYLNPGNDKFYKAINFEIYVDKTGLIQYTNRVFNTMQQNVCVSRPRRFGKSMTANMLAAYYSRGCQSEKLFEEFKIANDPSFRQHLNLSVFPIMRFRASMSMRFRYPIGAKCLKL